MSELDDFRPRIRNWARVFREHIARHESNIMPYLRSIDKELQKEAGPRLAPDFRDAEFIDESITALRQNSPEFNEVYPVMKVEYLTPFPESFESEADIKKARRGKAQLAKVFVWRYDENLRKAEQLLMLYVERKEKA